MDVNMSVLIFNNHWDEMTCFVDTRTLRRIQGDIDSMIVGCHFSHHSQALRCQECRCHFGDKRWEHHLIRNKHNLIALDGFYEILCDSQFEGCS